MVYLLALRNFHRTFDQKLKRSRVQGKAGPTLSHSFHAKNFTLSTPIQATKWWASNPVVE